MSTKDIITDVLSGNLSDARNKTEDLLYSKTAELLNQVKESTAGEVYEDAVGVASLVEKKKAKKKKNDDDDNGKKYAKKTDKEDDGEGLDPVDAEDSDVDNDGDSDESDEYLKNRRKVRKKEIEDDEEEVKEGYNVTAKHNDHIKASAAIGSGTRRRGPLAGGKSVGDKKYNLRFDSEETGKKFMQKHGFTTEEVEEVEESKGDGRESHIYGMPLKKYRALTDKQKHQIKMKWSHKKAQEEKAKGHNE